nr:uncharacterized protein LOC111512775 [Leptinotarsa decemlineata]
MNEQVFNVKFVGEVEKFPVLYNYRPKEYSRKDVTEKAWNEVAKNVNLSIVECKEKWKNLRSVFVRRLKPPPSGSGNTTKPYYLSEAMQFTLPYIPTVGKPDGNLPEVPTVPPSRSDVSQQLSEHPSQQHHLPEEEEDSHSPPPPPPPLSYSRCASPPVIKPHCTPSTTDSVSTPAFKNKRKQQTLTDVDKSFKDYMDA